MSFDFFVSYIFLEPVRYLFRYEDDLHFFPTLGISYEYFPVFNIIGRDFQDLSHSYSVSTVGLDEETIRKYIREQEALEKRQGEFDFEK